MALSYLLVTTEKYHGKGFKITHGQAENSTAYSYIAIRTVTGIQQQELFRFLHCEIVQFDDVMFPDRKSHVYFLTASTFYILFSLKRVWYGQRHKTVTSGVFKLHLGKDKKVTRMKYCSCTACSQNMAFLCALSVSRNGVIPVALCAKLRSTWRLSSLPLQTVILQTARLTSNITVQNSGSTHFDFSTRLFL